MFGDPIAYRSKMKKCKEVMTANPVCCTPDETVARVAKLMKTEDVGSVPICEDRNNRRLMGIITDRDLAILVVAAGKDPNSVKAREVMTRDPFTCRPDDDIHFALDAMEKHQVRRIAVTDSNGLLLGIIAQADVARRAEDRDKTAELVEEVSKPATVRAG
jgi:CBS domain-containing protein